MPQLIIGKQNNLAYTITVAANVATLVVSGETAWDLGKTDILRIVNTTHAGTFYLDPGSTFTQTFTAGLPVYTYTFTQYPATTVTGDTLLVYLLVNPQQLEESLLQYQKA